MTGGASWIAGAPTFRYYDAPVVRSLDPTVGPAAGGTLVLVGGAGFGPYPDLGDSVALCRFGSESSGVPVGSDGAMLQPVTGLTQHDMPLRTHLPRFVTTPATIIHQGALRCRAPAAYGLGEYSISVSLNGVDFSSSSSSSTGKGTSHGLTNAPRFHYYDNWMRPRVGGAPPSSRGAHASARLGSSLWVFGGWGDRRTAAGMWSEVRADGSEEEAAARRAAGGDESLHTLHNDLHELKTSALSDYYPSTHAPSLVWFPTNYTARAPDGTVSLGATPRVRSGHTLTTVGSRLVLVGGEAPSQITFPLSEQFEVSGLRMAHGSLVPRLRSSGDVFSPHIPIDPISEVYRGSREFLDAWDPNIQDAPELPVAEEMTEEERAREDTSRWLDEPVWEAREPTVRTYLNGQASLTHTSRDGEAMLRDGLGAVETARHVRSHSYVQQLEQLSDVYTYDVPSASWVKLAPGGVKLLSRTGHAATSITLRASTGETSEALAVFGGWRMAECGLPKPCGDFLNDLNILHVEPTPTPEVGATEQGSVGADEGSPSGGNGLHAAATRHWESPLIDGAPPMPRRGHTLTRLPQWHGGPYYADGYDGDPDAALIVMFGLGWLWNATASEGGAIYLNDVHVLHLANHSWYPLSVLGSPPAPRCGHSATLSPDGKRIIVFGGMDARGALADAHVLDLTDAREPIWWQLQPAGETPSPRHAHTATLFGTDLVVVGGMPALEYGEGVSLELLNLAHMEMQTSAPIAHRLVSDSALNTSCSLALGSEGSPVQRWTCGLRLREHHANVTTWAAASSETRT
jgi:hypothetical protein